MREGCLSNEEGGVASMTRNRISSTAATTNSIKIGNGIRPVVSSFSKSMAQFVRRGLQVISEMTSCYLVSDLATSFRMYSFFHIYIQKKTYKSSNHSSIASAIILGDDGILHLPLAALDTTWMLFSSLVLQWKLSDGSILELVRT